VAGNRYCVVSCVDQCGCKCFALFAQYRYEWLALWSHIWPITWLRGRNVIDSSRGLQGCDAV